MFKILVFIAPPSAPGRWKFRRRLQPHQAPPSLHHSERVASFPARLSRRTAWRCQGAVMMLWALSALGSHSLAQAPFETATDDPNHQHPAPGTSIVRFGQVDEGIYRGSSPKSDADFRFLQSKGIKYILALTYLPMLTLCEKRQAKKYGIVLIPAMMNASPLAPSEKHVHRILLTLRDPRFHPIYFQCAFGRDRTGLIAGLYGIYFKGMSPPDAWREMKHFGFKESWTLRGLKVYFEKHSQRRPSFADASAPAAAPPENGPGVGQLRPDALHGGQR
jgi:protein-tyrosine phosphatase family protein